MAMIHIKELTRAVDTKNRNWYNELSEAEKTEFSAWKTMRFISANVKDNEHELGLYLTNEIVNVNFNSLTKHPELQWKLLTCVGTGKVSYHPWISPGKRVKKDQLLEWFKNNFRNEKINNLEVLVQLSEKNEILEYAEHQGCTDKKLKELSKILND